VPGDRTLTYYIAHELAHTMVARRIGRRSYHALAPWQQEGYADYVGKGGAFDFDAARAEVRAIRVCCAGGSAAACNGCARRATCPVGCRACSGLAGA
jgi:hypothetical protein